MRLAAALACLSAVAAASAAAPADKGDKGYADRKARGAELYASCIRCHGQTGDEIDYPNILTLVGIGDRLRDEETSSNAP